MELLKLAVDILKWLNPQNWKRAKLDRILIVEDDAEAANALMQMLKACRVRSKIEIAVNAESAIWAIKRNHISVIFVDLQLKYMQGWDLVPLIERASPDTLIIVTCGVFDDVLRIQKPSIVFTVMRKPIGLDELRRFMARVKV